MAANLIASLLLNAITFVVHAVGLVALTRFTSYFVERPFFQGRLWPSAGALSLAACGLFVLLCVEMAIWAAAFVWIGAFADFGLAFYFSTSSFVTIGFGDVMPMREWQLLGALEGVTGFLIIGWSAAYLVTSGIRCGPFERGTHF